MEGGQYCVGSGNYSKVIETSFEENTCVAKVVRRYRDVHSPDRSERGKRQSDLEEKEDLHTECGLLQQLGSSTLMDWKWVPHMHMMVLHKDMPAEYSKRVTEAVGFEPAALLYMEQLEVTFDKYLQSSIEQMPLVAPDKRQEHDTLLLLLMCDLLATIVGMQRMGVRHNDLMLRNVMLRRRAVPAPGRRHLALDDSELEFVWPVHPHYEVVLIDFGLASVSPTSALHETDDTLIVHEDRDKAFGSSHQDAEVLYKHRHPLKCYRKAVGRNLMDLNCLWYSLHALQKRCVGPGTFAEWTKRYINILRQANRSTDATDRPPCLEKVVREVFPTECCVES